MRQALLIALFAALSGGVLYNIGYTDGQSLIEKYDDDGLILKAQYHRDKAEADGVFAEFEDADHMILIYAENGRWEAVQVRDFQGIDSLVAGTKPEPTPCIYDSLGFDINDPEGHIISTAYYGGVIIWDEECDVRLFHDFRFPDGWQQLSWIDGWNHKVFSNFVVNLEGDTLHAAISHRKTVRYNPLTSKQRKILQGK